MHDCFHFSQVYYQEFCNPWYISSIIISIVCICCQFFTYLAAQNNIHWNILAFRVMSIVVDIIGFFCISSWILFRTPYEFLHNSITSYYYWKFQWLTLPLSFGVSWLFILRAITIDYHINRGMTLAYLMLMVIGICSMCIMCSLFLDVCFNFVWIGIFVHRICNVRFSNADKNIEFWRKLIHWLFLNRSKNDSLLRLFTINQVFAHQLSTHFGNNPTVNQVFANQNLTTYVGKQAMSKWLNVWFNRTFKNRSQKLLRTIVANQSLYDKYLTTLKSVFTGLDELSIANEIMKDIHQQRYEYRRRHNQNQEWIDSYFSAALLLLKQEVDYYFNYGNAVQNMEHFFVDLVNCFNLCNAIDVQHINSVSRMFWSIPYFFTRYGIILYIFSGVLTFLFPFFYLYSFVSYTSAYYRLTGVGYFVSFQIIITLLYAVCICILLFLWFTQTCFATRMIWYLCPGYYQTNVMYVGSEEHDIMFDAILWQYKWSRDSSMIVYYLFLKFGNDIASIIADYLPHNYHQSLPILMKE